MFFTLKGVFGDGLNARDAVVGRNYVSLYPDLSAEQTGIVHKIEGITDRTAGQLDGHTGRFVGAGRLVRYRYIGPGGERRGKRAP